MQTPDSLPNPKPALRTRQAYGLLALITLLGLVLRLWGIGWSLPDARHPLATYHPDELVNLNAALAADIPHGKLDIQFYNYGTFYFYLVSFAHTFGRGWELIPSAPQGASPLGIEAAAEHAALFLAGRLVTVLLGTATILVLFALGQRLFGRKTGLMAALLYAIAPFAVVHAHFLTVDVPATFFVTLALLWAVKIKQEPGWKSYALAGVWVGVAAATKYTVAPVLVVPLSAHFLNKIPDTCTRHRNAQLVVLLCITAIAFLVACPGPVLNLAAFWDGIDGYPGSGVRYELFEHSRTGHGDLFVNTGLGWWYHLVISLRYGLSEPLLLLSLCGLGWACVKRSWQDLLLLSFFLLYYLLTGLSAVRFARYMIPLFPVLCVLAGRLMMEPMANGRLRRNVLAGGAVATTLTLAISSMYTLAMSQTDPRDRTATMLEQDAKPGASVAFAKVPWFYSPPLSPLFGAPAALQRARAADRTTRFQLRIPTTEWNTEVLNPAPDYIVLSNIETMHTVDRLKQPEAVRFVQEIPSNYRIWRAQTTTSLWTSGSLIPEDLLYILPIITVYIRQ